MIDVDVPRSPGWWLKRLSAELVARNTSPEWRTSSLRRDARPPLELLSDYLRGDPPLPRLAQGWREGFRDFLRMSRMNYAELVCLPTVERMVPVSFRTAAVGDENGDPEAERFMRAAELDLKLADVYLGMTSLGDGYAIVGEPDAETGVPLVTAEDARQVITAHDPATGAYLAALKLFRDDWDSTDFAYVYLPDGSVNVARRNGGGASLTRFSARSWEWDEDRSWTMPFARVPVVRFQNRGGVGEFEPHLDVLDRINDTTLDRVVISKVQAFRQRAVKNLPTTDEKTGEDIDYTDVFAADPGSMWQVPDGVEFWESSPVDLTPIRMSIKDDVEGLAAVTRTPLHLITPDAASGSAEGASLMREGQIFKVEDRRRRADSSNARLLSMMFEFSGDSVRAERAAVQTVWAPAERFSLTEKASAASQMKGNLPQAAIWTDVLQYTPGDVPRLESMRGADLLYALTQQPTQPSSQVVGDVG